MPLPEPPVNVRLVYANGVEVAVDCVYTGRDERGIHLWEVVKIPTHGAQLVKMKIDKLPDHTEVSASGNWRSL